MFLSSLPKTEISVWFSRTFKTNKSDQTKVQVAPTAFVQQDAKEDDKNRLVFNGLCSKEKQYYKSKLIKQTANLTISTFFNRFKSGLLWNGKTDTQMKII